MWLVHLSQHSPCLWWYFNWCLGGPGVPSHTCSSLLHSLHLVLQATLPLQPPWWDWQELQSVNPRSVSYYLAAADTTYWPITPSLGILEHYTFLVFLLPQHLLLLTFYFESNFCHTLSSHMHLCLILRLLFHWSASLHMLCCIQCLFQMSNGWRPFRPLLFSICIYFLKKLICPFEDKLQKVTI